MCRKRRGERRRGRRGKTYVDLPSLIAHRIYTQRMSASVASRVTSWAMRDVADQTRLDLTKVVLGGSLNSRVRGGNPFISYTFPIA